jgi:hypothetical protein
MNQLSSFGLAIPPVIKAGLQNKCELINVTGPFSECLPSFFVE